MLELVKKIYHTFTEEVPTSGGIRLLNTRGYYLLAFLGFVLSFIYGVDAGKKEAKLEMSREMSSDYTDSQETLLNKQASQDLEYIRELKVMDIDIEKVILLREEQRLQQLKNLGCKP